MKMALGLWLLALGLLTATAQAQCVADQWCNVFTNGGSVENGTPEYKQNGWNKAIYVHDLDRIFLTGQGNETDNGTLCNPTSPAITTPACASQLYLTTTNSPYSNDQFFAHPKITGGQPDLYTVPPYTAFYNSGITENYPLPAQQGAHLWLTVNPHDPAVEQRPLSATDMQVTLCNKTTTCDSTTASGFIQALPPAGSISLDDEVLDYSDCTAYGDAGRTITSYSGDGATATYIVANNFQAGWTVQVYGLATAFNGLVTVTAATSTQFQAANTTVRTTTSASGTALRYPPDLTTPLAARTGGGVTASCNQAAFQYVLTVSGRGRRQGAGWTAATTHNVNDAAHPNQGWAWLVTPKIFNGDGTVRYGARVNTTFNLNSLSFAYGTNQAAGEFDGPTSRHQRGVLNYDSKRGKLWYFMGFQEMTSNLKDLWWSCVYAPASGPTGSGTFSDKCAAGDLGKSYQHANLSLTTGAPPCCFTETDTIYLPDPFDALVHFGGLLSGGHSDLNIMCLSDTSVPVKACHPSDGDINNAASYVPRQFFLLADNVAFQGSNGPAVNGFATCTGANCHGNPGLRDGPTLAYDPLGEKMLIAGGKTSTNNCPTGGVCWTSIAQWNPRTSDYCLSDTRQNGLVRGGATYYEFNGAGCNTTNPAFKQAPLPDTGAAPLVESTSLYFVAATWNSSLNKLLLYKGDEASATTSGLFLYDPSANTWSRTGVVSGPPPHTTGNAIYQAGLSLVHDDVHSMNWLVEAHSGLNIGIWELADSAITGTPPTPTYTLTVYGAGAGSGSILDSPHVNVTCTWNGSANSGDCNQPYSDGSTVTLTAQSTGGSIFAGWGGGCSGTADCTLTMSADVIVTANFNPPAAPSATTYSGMSLQGVQVQ